MLEFCLTKHVGRGMCGCWTGSPFILASPAVTLTYRSQTLSPPGAAPSQSAGRNYDPPEYHAAAGADSHGRLLEMVGVELDEGSLLIFHAMRLTDKMAQELQVRREST